MAVQTWKCVTLLGHNTDGNN